MIHHGDCLAVMPTLTANSVDAIVTDPPYGLSFMGKDWDHGIPGVEFWKAAYRVMKPGAFLLSFGGTRTFHRLTCAIEDAGFEIRDCMMWLYGSGFPKSHDVSKAIDKAKGAEREVIGIGRGTGKQNPAWNGTGAGRAENSLKPEFELTAPATEAARQWSGWGTALKPAWEPIIVARKPLEGTVAENVLKWGTGGMNIDGGRIGINESDDIFSKNPHTQNQGKDGGWCTSGSNGSGYKVPSGRWPANLILDEAAVAILDEQSGTLKSGVFKKRRTGSQFLAYANDADVNGCQGGDSGGASRFFYCAKTSKRERGEGNNHPTVKPIALLTYLAKLVCPPGGVILDPFAGSGSMGVAAQNLGFQFIGIEREANYCEIAKVRLGLVAA